MRDMGLDALALHAVKHVNASSALQLLVHMLAVAMNAADCCGCLAHSRRELGIVQAQMSQKVRSYKCTEALATHSHVLQVAGLLTLYTHLTALEAVGSHHSPLPGKQSGTGWQHAQAHQSTAACCAAHLQSVASAPYLQPTGDTFDIYYCCTRHRCCGTWACAYINS